MRAIDPSQDAGIRIEAALAQALALACAMGAPAKLSSALHYAVFPGGARIRPRLTLSVAQACGDDVPALSGAAAAAVELLHCASLVHDDLPCFDGADTRRGKASVHKAFGEALAVLAGDGLIILAFETIATADAAQPQRAIALSRIIAQATGMPGGIVAGQAWESEPSIDLVRYQQSKTGSLFAGAAKAGACAAGADPQPWAALGFKLGEAFQVADDIRDICCNATDIGKPIGQDAAHGRPNAVSEIGLRGAVHRLSGLIDEAVASVPECSGQSALREKIERESRQFLPRDAALAVA